MRISARTTRFLLVALVLAVYSGLPGASPASAYSYLQIELLSFDTFGSPLTNLAYRFNSFHEFRFTKWNLVESIQPVLYNTSIYKNHHLWGTRALCTRLGVVLNHRFSCTNVVDDSCPSVEGVWYADGGAEIPTLLTFHYDRSGPTFAQCSKAPGEQCQSCPECEICPGSPIILDLDRNGFHLSGLDDGTWFDIDADGSADRLSWTSASQSDGFLVLDRNGNGTIDSGRELFGNHTQRIDGSMCEHGYQALEELDLGDYGGNENGVIDPGDSIFADLQVWVDANHDGTSQASELRPLGELGLRWIGLDTVVNERRDRHGNRFRYNSKAAVEGPGRGDIPLRTADVFFVVAE